MPREDELDAISNLKLVESVLDGVSLVAKLAPERFLAYGSFVGV